MVYSKLIRGPGATETSKYIFSFDIQPPVFHNHINTNFLHQLIVKYFQQLLIYTSDTIIDVN